MTESHQPLPARLSRRLGRIVRLTASEFLGDRCFDKSASLAYVSLLGIFAVFTVVLSIQTMLFANNRVMQKRLESFIFEWFLPSVATAESPLVELPLTPVPATGEAPATLAMPVTAEVAAGLRLTPNAEAQRAMRAVVNEKFRELVGIFDDFRQKAPGLGAIGILGLVIVSMMLFTSVEKGFNEVFHVRRKRPLIRAFITYTAVLVWAPIFLGITFALSLQVGERVGWLSPGTTALVMTCGTFALAYWLIPNTRVSPLSALAGGIVAGLLWEVLKRGFVLYLVYVPTMNNFLTLLGIIPTFLIWLYMTWAVLFLGLELSYVLQHYRPLAGRLSLPAAALDLNPRHLLTALFELSRRFEQGQPRTTVADLMRATHLDERGVHRLLDHCLEQGWIFSTEAHTAYHLARPPEQIALREVLLTPLTMAGEEGAADGPPALEEFWRRCDRAVEGVLPARTLRDLMCMGSGPERIRTVGDAP